MADHLAPPASQGVPSVHGTGRAARSVRTSRHSSRQGRRLRHRRRAPRQVRDRSEKFWSAAEASFGFCDVIFGWDIGDVLYDNAQRHRLAHRLPRRARADRPLDLPRHPVGAGHRGVPRRLRQRRRLASPRVPALAPEDASSSAPSAWATAPTFAAEFEFFVFKETPQSLHQKGFRGLDAALAGNVRLLVGARGAEQRVLPRDPRRDGGVRHPDRGPPHRDRARASTRSRSATTKRSRWRTRPRSSRRG